MICRIATINECGTRFNLWRESTPSGVDFFEVVGAHMDPPTCLRHRTIRGALREGLAYPRPKVLFLCNTKNSC